MNQIKDNYRVHLLDSVQKKVIFGLYVFPLHPCWCAPIMPWSCPKLNSYTLH